MLNILLTWLLSAISLMITAYLVPGITISGFGAAAVAVVVIGLVNAIIRPILVILTLPITILSMGLFLLVINAITLSLASYFTPDTFVVNGFWPAFFGAIVLTLVSSVINSFASNQV
ncbi:MAG: phage holin family protein [Moorea sp. SIO4A3]|nr:phage holin family protein [Moorena sp. SIO4A3]